MVGSPHRTTLANLQSLRDLRYDEKTRCAGIITCQAWQPRVQAAIVLSTSAARHPPVLWQAHLTADIKVTLKEQFSQLGMDDLIFVQVRSPRAQCTHFRSLYCLCAHCSFCSTQAALSNAAGYSVARCMHRHQAQMALPSLEAKERPSRVRIPESAEFRSPPGLQPPSVRVVCSAARWPWGACVPRAVSLLVHRTLCAAVASTVRRRPTFAEAKRVVRILSSVFIEKAPETMPAGVTAAASSSITQPAADSEQQAGLSAAGPGAAEADAVEDIPPRLHRAAASGDADKVPLLPRALLCVAISLYSREGVLPGPCGSIADLLLLFGRQ